MEKVTLYVPCYNAEKYIAECLEGILKQTYPIDEILIIDDGSTDKTVEIASKYPVKIIKHEVNKGLAAARNTAFKNAKNEFVASLDVDCFPEPDWLEKLMENFTDENIAGVGGKLIEKYTDTIADKWRAVHMKQNWGDERIVNPDFLFGSNNVYRKKAVEDVGYFNERYRTNYEDVDLCSRIKGSLIYEPRAIVKHLRRDTIFSIIKAYWRWHYSEHGVRSFYNSSYKNIILTYKLLKKDIYEKNLSLIIVDIIQFFYHLKLSLSFLK